MASILPIDELNAFESQVSERVGKEKIVYKDDLEDILDLMLDLFLLAYAQGNEITNVNLASDWIPTLDDVMKTVDEKVAGKTWKERTEEYFANGGTGADIVRIADTEMHRIANTAALETARHGGATSKTWVTMLDNRVREQHEWLEGVTVGIDEDFYTDDGDHASAPGLFELAQNNVNCRCELIFS